MKYDWKKNDKQLYLPKNEPSVIDDPAAKYFMISGKGNPNHADFEDAVGVLYSLSYIVKMLPKKGVTPEGYFEYSVYPLEGVWDLEEEGRQENAIDKNKLIYTIMIRQPDFVTESLAQEVMEAVKKKKPHQLLNKATFGKLKEGMCLHMMHHGSYDDECKSFIRMEQFCDEHSLQRMSKTHKEIYISDSNCRLCC